MKRGLSLFVMCVLGTTLSAESGPPLTLEARAKGAQMVVVASVGNVNSWYAVNQYGDQLIVSQVTLNVEERLKGNVAAPGRLDMQVEGGTVGNITLRVSDMPSLQAGERAVVFLEYTPSGTLIPHRRGLGILKLQGDAISGTDISLARVRDTVRQASGR
jgi:hypothetical protein